MREGVDVSLRLNRDDLFILIVPVAEAGLLRSAFARALHQQSQRSLHRQVETLRTAAEWPKLMFAIERSRRVINCVRT